MHRISIVSIQSLRGFTKTFGVGFKDKQEKQSVDNKQPVHNANKKNKAPGKTN